MPSLISEPKNRLTFRSTRTRRRAPVCLNVRRHVRLPTLFDLEYFHLAKIWRVENFSCKVRYVFTPFIRFLVGTRHVYSRD